MLDKIEQVINDVMISVIFHDVKIQKKLTSMLFWNIFNIKIKALFFYTLKQSLYIHIPQGFFYKNRQKTKFGIFMS